MQTDTWKVADDEHCLTVLVTGATGNIGKACMKRSKGLGWSCVPTSRSMGLDLSDWGATRGWIAKVDRVYDLVIMAHGKQIPATLEELDEDLWYEVMAANLDSCAALTTALFQEDSMAYGGLIVYISSIQATQPRAGR